MDATAQDTLRDLPAWSRDRDLAARYDVKRQTIWDWTRKGLFPLPVKLSPGCVRWRRDDVLAWERQRAGEVA